MILRLIKTIKMCISAIPKRLSSWAISLLLSSLSIPSFPTLNSFCFRVKIINTLIYVFIEAILIGRYPLQLIVNIFRTVVTQLTLRYTMVSYCLEVIPLLALFMWVSLVFAILTNARRIIQCFPEMGFFFLTSHW
jgi:hypothetical protein